MKKRLLLAIGILFVGYGVVFYIAPLFFPLPEEFEKGAPQGLLFVDREGTPVRRFLDNDLRASEPASFEEFSPLLINATLAAEDSRFYSHNGIDLLGVMRAGRDAVLHRRFVSGASTVTQQTVKIYSPPRERTFRTKAWEALSARKLEMCADKETILTAYLNCLPYGNQFTGARAAAEGYFGKPIRDLSLAEAALLAGLPNKPTRLNPWRNLEGARKRQQWILERMRTEEWITEAEYESALSEPLRLLPGSSQVFHAPHFVELVERTHPEVIRESKDAGTPVRTTLDLSLQTFVESTVSAELSRLAHESKEADDLQAAVVVLENETGNILALTGSRSFFRSRGGQINGAWEPRSAGSTLKPFTYLLAFERGYHPSSIIADTPIEYVTSTGTYQPVNFDRRFHGPVSLRRALACSYNVPAVKLLDSMGGPKVLHEALTSKLGMTSLSEGSDEFGLGLTLGNAPVRLLELTHAYSCLARLGRQVPYRLVAADASPQGQANDSTLFDPDLAWILADVLSDNQARVEAFGLHSPLRLPFRVAAKTGTSTDFRDNWTLGYTPDFTVGVWVGRFDNRPMNKISGALGAAPLFHRIMTELHREQAPRWYDRPEGARRIAVDKLSGMRPPASLSLSPSRITREWFLPGHAPAKASETAYSPEGKTFLSRDYHHWWEAEEHTFASIAELRPLAPHEEKPNFRIVSPVSGTVAFLDPDLPGNGGKFPLEIAGNGDEQIRWESSSLSIKVEGSHHWLLLEPGEHEVTAVDQRSGRSVTSSVVVKAL